MPRQLRARGVPDGSPLALPRGQFLVGFRVVERKNPTRLRHQSIVAIHRSFDERDAGGVHTIEKHAPGGQARRGVTFFCGGPVDRQRVVWTMQCLDKAGALEPFVRGWHLDRFQPSERGSERDMLRTMLAPRFAMSRDPSFVEPVGQLLEMPTEQRVPCRSLDR